MKRRVLLIATLISIALQTSATGKVYAVIMGATLDDKIGESCKTDLDRFENEIATLTNNLDFDRMPTIRLDGAKCDRPNMEQAFAKLRNSTEQDIVFFYYTGHGGRSTRDQSKFPQMVMNYRDERNFVPVHEVAEKISTLPAHLKLVITDCCNNKSEYITPKDIDVLSRGATESNVDYEQLEKLFIKNKGTIVATSSDIGQVSLCNQYGGFFSISFWYALSAASTGDIEASWNEVLKRTETYTLNISRNQQKPIYELNITSISGYTSTSTTNHNNNNNVSTNNSQTVVGNSDVNASMLSAISQLLNRQESIQNRVRKIDGIVSTYFASSTTRVQTVGRDMQTIVDTEDVSTFLRRLCFDNKIKQINVVTATKDSNSRCSYLKVHEVRLPLK